MVYTEGYPEVSKSHGAAGPFRPKLEEIVTNTLSARLSRVSSAPSLNCLTREARYARDEAALRLALSRCDTEPSPLELQVRVMEKGLQAWTARAGRGYERVQNAEEAIATVRRKEEVSNVARSSLSDLQREKWMGMKERDEALAMVDKIKGLIAELHTEIQRGSRVSISSKPTESLLSKDVDATGSVSVNDTPSKKAAILFSGKLPSPYLERLPRSRHSVEPLRLPLKQSQVVNPTGRKRSSTLRSEQTVTLPSTPTSVQPSTPPPKTPIDEFGAAVIYSALPIKTVAHYLSDITEEGGAQTYKDRLSHLRLPSYVDTLLEELVEDRIGIQQLRFNNTSSRLSSPPERPSPTLNSDISSPISRRSILRRRSRDLLGRHSHIPPSQSKENLDPSRVELPLQTNTVPSVILPSTATGPSYGAFLPQNAHMKSSNRMETMIRNVKKGVMKVSRLGE